MSSLDERIAIVVIETLWACPSRQFVKFDPPCEETMRRIARLPTYGHNLRSHNRPQNRKPSLTPWKPKEAFPVSEIIAATAAHHGVEPSEYIGFRSSAAGRELAALLCLAGRRIASSLSKQFGLAHPDSSSNLNRRAKKRCEESQGYQRTVTTLERTIGLTTENPA